jgi:hypothetical protein
MDRLGARPGTPAPQPWSSVFARDGVLYSFSHMDMATGRQFDLPYMVEQWDDADSRVEELIALTGDYRVARAAFDEAVKRRPGRIGKLRQKTRLLAAASIKRAATWAITHSRSNRS